MRILYKGNIYVKAAVQTKEEIEEALKKLEIENYTIGQVAINNLRDEWHITLPFPKTLDPKVTDRQLYNVPICKKIKDLMLSTFQKRCRDHRILVTHDGSEKRILLIFSIVKK